MRRSQPRTPAVCLRLTRCVLAGSSCSHLALRCDDFDADEATAWLESHSVEVINSGSRFGADGQGFSLYVRDPEGNVVELKKG